MPNALPENYTDFVRRRVESLVENQLLFEMECPGYTAMMKNSRSYPLTQKGFQIPFFETVPGQIAGYTAQNTSFGDYVPAVGISMYIFPTYLAMPMIFAGPTINMLQSGAEDKVTSFGDVITQHVTEFKKRLEQITVGDGTGSMAYAATTVSTLGTQTFTGETAASTVPGHTKGATWLRKNHFYQAIDVSTGLPRGTFQVTVPAVAGAATCTVTLLQGSWSSGDPIVEPGCYLRVPKGLGFLISNVSRTLQGLSTAANPGLNSTEVDLASNLCTPATFNQVKTALQMRSNEMTAENQLLCYCTSNFYSILKAQGWNLTIQSLTETTGIQKRYSDGDTAFVLMTDMDEDRAYLFRANNMPMFEERKLGVLNFDGQEWRMLFGDNGTGSDSYQRALGMAYQAAILQGRRASYIKRALTTGTSTQVAVGN